MPLMERSHPQQKRKVEDYTRIICKQKKRLDPVYSLQLPLQYQNLLKLHGPCYCRISLCRAK